MRLKLLEHEKKSKINFLFYSTLLELDYFNNNPVTQIF